MRRFIRRGGWLAALLTAPVLAQTAGMLSFQGLIKDSNGNPVNGIFNLEFRIFDAQTGGILKAGPFVAMGVPTANGVASTKFGPVDPPAFDGAERWLEVTVNASSLSRIEMATAPAASEQVNRPGSGETEIYVNAETGFVGIGTPNPTTDLHVAGSVRVAPPVFDQQVNYTLMYNDPNESGPPGEDAFRIRYDWSFSGGTADELVIEKTDGNQNPPDPDGGIAFVNTGVDGVPETAMVIRGDGRIGIGTASPTTDLHVAGGARIGTNQGSISMGQDPNASIELREEDGSGTPYIDFINDAATDFDARIRLVGNDVLAIEGAFVGIGTTSPQAELQVDGEILADTLSAFEGEVTFFSCGSVLSQSASIADGRVTAGDNASNAGLLFTSGDNLSLNCVIANPVGLPNHGYVSVHDSIGSLQAGMYVDSSGNGIVFGDTESFRVPHPSQAGMEIWYACPEGPEAAAYVRGTAQLVAGNAVVVLPDHFGAVATASGMTVQRTPLSAESKGLCVTQKGLDVVLVRELSGGQGSYDFDYLITAVRKGHEEFRVVRSAEEARPVVVTTAGDPLKRDAARQPASSVHDAAR